jgi:aspartate oxidase
MLDLSVWIRHIAGVGVVRHISDVGFVNFHPLNYFFIRETSTQLLSEEVRHASQN